MSRESATPAFGIAARRPERPLAAEVKPDTRSEPRTRALKTCKIVLNAEFSTINCVLKNRAGHGAKLQLESVYVPPEMFEVYIESEGAIAPARKVWQIGKQVGVEFLEPFRPA
ncbi:MAG: hypothetical protein AAFR11_14620 [Pseudomonadota bacterium]